VINDYGDRKMNINIKINKKVILILLPIAYIFIGNMKAVYSTPLPFQEWVLMLYTLIGLICLLFFCVTRKIYINNPLIILLFFTLFSIIPTFSAYYDYSMYTAIHMIGQSLFWVASFTLSYVIAYKSRNSIQSAKLITILIPIFAILFFNVRQFSAGRGIPDIITAYYNLFLLPFLLTVNKKALKFSLLIIIFTTIILSMKRAGFLAFILALFVYFLIHYKSYIYSKKRLYVIFSGVMTAMLLFLFFDFFIKKYEITILSRLYAVFDDLGSGRYEIWKKTWNMIKCSDFFSLLFGHGFNAVYMDSVPQYSAHTDLLEVIYDYGILGSIFYLCFYLRLIKYYKHLNKIKSEIAAPFASSLCIALVISAFSHLIIYPTYFIFNCIFWGLVTGECDREFVKNERLGLIANGKYNCSSL